MDFHATIVFHELRHVFHNFNGDLKVESSRPELQKHSQLLLEKVRTVGLGTFSEETLSENKFHEEIGVPRRIFYSPDSAFIHDDNTVSLRF
ncbi:T3SS secreted effector NleD-like protein [Escherichia coli]|nr:T3SS secreted effector NleD-like protein [Escherichia coli]